MSWLDQIKSRLWAFGIAATFVSVVAACGFQPIAVPGIEDAPAEIRLRSVTVTVDDDRFEYRLTEEMLDHILIDPNSSFGLAVSVDIARSGLAVTADDEITRYNIRATATFVLSGLTEDDSIRGTFVATTSLNATSSIFSTEILEREARSLLAEDIARRMITRLQQERVRDPAL